MVSEKQQNGNALINRYLGIGIVKLFKFKKNKPPFFKVDKPVKMLLLVAASKTYSTHHTKCHHRCWCRFFYLQIPVPFVRLIY